MSTLYYAHSTQNSFHIFLNRGYNPMFMYYSLQILWFIMSLFLSWTMFKPKLKLDPLKFWFKRVPLYVEKRKRKKFCLPNFTWHLFVSQFIVWWRVYVITSLFLSIIKNTSFGAWGKEKKGKGRFYLSW